MDKIGSKVALLKEKVKGISFRISDLKKENQKLRDMNEELLSKVNMFEEENKMVRKYVKERDIIKGRIKSIIENIERAKI
ncbi:MAG: hypothetical protein PHE88_00225 [Elusimicrobia bacterium]|nr:hypothetical protein [Elusimicrobiota bacterium]